MVFETKVAILLLDGLAVWQKLNVTAFLSTGIAPPRRRRSASPYEDAAGRQHARLLIQPINGLRRRPGGAWPGPGGSRSSAA